jgi:anti-sigma factor RsiW
VARALVCKEVVELVTEYLEGTLSRRDRKRFEQHIAGCEACTAYLASMRRTIATTGRLTEDRIPANVRDDLVAAFRDWRGSSA